MGKRERKRERQRKKKVAAKITSRGVRKTSTGDAVAERGQQQKQRQQQKQQRKRQYLPDERTLVVGDGDFTFSLGLYRHRGNSRCGLVCTGFDSASDVRSKYRNSDATITALREKGVPVFHGVDARRLGATLGRQIASNRGGAIGGREEQVEEVGLFDVIVFNFPHTGRQRVHLNQALLADFFASASPILRETTTARIEVAQKVRKPYVGWKIEEQASKAGLRLVGQRPFDPSAFPGYQHRTTDPQANKFDWRFARVFTFQKRAGTSRLPGSTEAKGQARASSTMAKDTEHWSHEEENDCFIGRPKQVDGYVEEQAATARTSSSVESEDDGNEQEDIEDTERPYEEENEGYHRDDGLGQGKEQAPQLPENSTRDAVLVDATRISEVRRLVLAMAFVQRAQLRHSRSGAARVGRRRRRWALQRPTFS